MNNEDVMILVIIVVTSMPSSHVWIHVIKYFITCPRYKNIYQTDESNLYGCQWVEPLPDGLISTYIPYVKIKGNMKGYGWSSSRRVLPTTLRPLLWVPPSPQFQKSNHRREFDRSYIIWLLLYHIFNYPFLQNNPQIQLVEEYEDVIMKNICHCTSAWW